MPPGRNPAWRGPERVLKHRADEPPSEYKSTLRSAYVDPKSHSDFFSKDSGLGMGGRSARELAAFTALAEAEAADREAAYQVMNEASTELV